MTLTAALVSSLVLSGLNAPAPDPDEGLYIGEMQLCAETVYDAYVFEDKYADRALLIEFTEGAAALIADITQARIGQALPVTLDGRVIAEPTILEPITEGEIVLSGGFDFDLEAVALRATAPCV